MGVYRQGIGLLAFIAAIGAELDRNSAFVGYQEGVQCADQNEFCKSWQENGECDKNPGYMLESCKKSCGRCDTEVSHQDGSNGQLNSVNSEMGGGIGIGEKQLARSTHLVLSTEIGDINIKLRPDLAPKTVEFMQNVASEGCDGCQFYRSESIPKPGAIDNFGGPGPPYALVQGRMIRKVGGPPKLPKEGAPVVKRGMVCLIGAGPDFFVAVGDHTEWGNAHTVWGEVSDMSTVDAITNLPKREEVWGATHVTSLVTPLPFTPRLLSL